MKNNNKKASIIIALAISGIAIISGCGDKRLTPAQLTETQKDGTLKIVEPEETESGQDYNAEDFSEDLTNEEENNNELVKEKLAGFTGVNPDESQADYSDDNYWIVFKNSLMIDGSGNELSAELMETRQDCNILYTKENNLLIFRCENHQEEGGTKYYCADTSEDGLFAALGERSKIRDAVRSVFRLNPDRLIENLESMEYLSYEEKEDTNNEKYDTISFTIPESLYAELTGYHIDADTDEININIKQYRENKEPKYIVGASRTWNIQYSVSFYGENGYTCIEINDSNEDLSMIYDFYKEYAEKIHIDEITDIVNLCPGGRRS